ncbi:PcfB family protein [Candidatus Merdisoma sp. HCP28S3_D10]|uniref:PcfB family protein n=1 Tax=Candidatus Merdisoma sp. HCP28S3_D10 TaxID=3438869 RepID=UPI003F88EBD6
MLKSGKELKVFSVPQKDLKKFTEQAKKYGVLYCVLRDKFSKDENAPVDIIARAEDASKIQRIFDRFELGNCLLTDYCFLQFTLKKFLLVIKIFVRFLF